MDSWRNTEGYVGFLEDKVDELERMLGAAIKWIKHDCPYDDETIYKELEKEVRDE